MKRYYTFHNLYTGVKITIFSESSLRARMAVKIVGIRNKNLWPLVLVEEKE